MSTGIQCPERLGTCWLKRVFWQEDFATLEHSDRKVSVWQHHTNELVWPYRVVFSFIHSQTLRRSMTTPSGAVPRLERPLSGVSSGSQQSGRASLKTDRGRLGDVVFILHLQYVQVAGVLGLHHDV